jgi:hypothetical protein
MEKNILTNDKTKIKVSSTLKGSKEYIKENILDNNPQTSWYSDQGKFQYIYLFFENKINFNEIDITFDGGFSPKEIEIYVSENNEFENKKPSMKMIKIFEVLDTNKEQNFLFDNYVEGVQTIRILCKKFFDLYGRIIVYNLKVKG